MLEGDVYTRPCQESHGPHPVPNGQDLLHRVEGHGGGLEGESMEQGLLKREVRGVKTLQDIRLQPVTRHS